ncbi:hypothetical protein BV22DRAFT_1129298 [Leucogyrophana mollusca]|uniref:Uncharacterized protein n=1 Tax=Leucogyrophana mollusca TaxID=85980 RepID=A0ACB8BH11_9AGAM|nr:hypothetical protein BV22DRAFT_1129298 [Leucogyrophana mollusca]
MSIPGSLKRPSSDIEPPAATRPRLAMSDTKFSNLAFAENELDDATHKSLDDAVLSESGEPSNMIVAAPLLLDIIEKSNGTLDTRHASLRAVRELLNQHEELLGMLQAAWRKRSFRDIRNLGMSVTGVLSESLSQPVIFLQKFFVLCLQRHPDVAVCHSWTPTPKNGVFRSPFLSLPSVIDNDSQVVMSAWNRPYTGDHHHLLLRNINKMQRGKPYSNTVAIIQSSGSGKSRLVREQSSLVFTLPFNLRFDAESKQLAYPPPDRTIRDYILAETLTLPESQVRCLRLLAHVFSVVSSSLNEMIELLKEKQHKRTSLAEDWRAYMEAGNNRTRMYDLVVNDCKNLEEKCLRTEKRGEPATVQAAVQEAKSQLEALLKRIDDNDVTPADGKSNNVKLMFYFDEAHVLATRPVLDNADGKDMYDVLCSCLNFFTSYPIFAIFLSTDSIINQLAPQGSLARSARMRQHSNALQAPVTETPFDCSPAMEIIPGELKLLDLSKVEFMARFGRPLFWTMLPADNMSEDNISSLIIDFARAKLICHNDIGMQLPDMSAGAKIAILDVLLCLDSEHSSEAAKTRQTELVAGHMRTAFSVPSDRSYLRSCYPSEPILAEAAAQQMDELQRKCPGINVMATLLNQQFTGGLIDRGLRSELVWRQLVMDAYLRAVRTEQQDDLVFSRGCGLITFIKELFTETYAGQILSSAPDNVHSTTKFAEAFKDARVRFTHFGKMADDTGATSPALLAAFIRGMAIICWNSQDLVDVVIPVLLNPNDPLAVSSMTGILMQVKLRRNAGPVPKYAIDQKVVGLFAHTEEQDVLNPYITLVAELGVQLRMSPAAVTKARVRVKLEGENRPTAMQTPRKHAVAQSSKTTPSKLHIPQQPRRTSHATKTHPRYSIFAYGCSNTVYRVIEDESRLLYKSLLANKDFLNEHPRQDEDSLAAVRRLKPFWTIGAACYHWIRLPFLRGHHETVPDEEGRVIVGAPMEHDESDSNSDMEG